VRERERGGGGRVSARWVVVALENTREIFDVVGMRVCVWREGGGARK